MSTEKGVAVFNVGGNEVKLSAKAVRDMLVKGNSDAVSDGDINQFIALCKFNKLNPFLNEAYLVKYGTAPATMIVSKEAFFKRADEAPNYEGIEAGVIVKRGEDVIELEGAFFLDTDVLLGGWAKVYRSDRRKPFVARVRLSEYDTGKSNWLTKKATMISKVAKVQSLREAFPTQLGAMYTPEESVQDIPYEEVPDQKKIQNANSQPLDMPAQDTPTPEPVQAQMDLGQQYDAASAPSDDPNEPSF